MVVPSRRAMSRAFIFVLPVGFDQEFDDAVGLAVGEIGSAGHFGEAPAKRTNGEQLVAADGFVELFCEDRVQLAFAVDGQSLVEPGRYIAQAGEGEMADQYMGQFMDDGGRDPIRDRVVRCR